MKKQLQKTFNMKKTALLLLAFIGLCSFQMNAQVSTTYTDSGDGLWITAGNWSNGFPGAGDTANLTETVDLGGVNRPLGQLVAANNTNAKTYFNGTLTLDGTTVSNTDQIIRIRSNKAITVTCDVVVSVDGKEIETRNINASQLIFNTGTFALGSNTVNVDNQNTETTTIPVEFNGLVTGDASSSINIINQDVSLGASVDFSGFTGSITFGGTNGLLTVNGANTIEGSIGVLSASDGNSKIEFNANQSGLANLTVDTGNLAIDFDAAATSVVFSGYTTSGTEGIVDLQNYVSGSLRIGTTSTGVPSAVLDTWTVDGAAATITQDADGYILSGAPAEVTFTTTANGTWEDDATWVGGVAPSAATDNVIVNHNITINSDVVVNDFSIVEDGRTERVTVEAGFSITINGDAVTKHQLIANSTATSFASLIFSTTGSTSQNIGYNRYINSNANGNDLISSAVPDSFAQIDEDFYANPADATQVLFGPFDNTAAAGSFTNWDTGGTFGTLVVGKGYRAATDAGSTVEFKDAITSPVADITASITDGGHATFGEWNLIGNPYHSYLNFGTFFTENSGEFHLDNVAVYGWNGSGYTTWNGANSSDKLTPGQGFFVRTKDGVTGTVTFTPAMRTTGNSNDFVTTKSANVKKALAKINLSNATKTFSTNIYFIENQTKGLDFGYDAGAFAGSTDGIFTNLVEDNEGLKLAIQSLAYDDYNNVTVPVVVNSAADVELTIGLDVASLTLPENTYVYLKDNVLNTTTLLNDVDYVFTPDTALSGAGRFFLEFSSKAVLATDDFAVNEMLIYTNQASKSIMIKGILKADANVKVFDVQGRLVLDQKLDSSNVTNVVNANALNTGVYMVQLEDKIQKVIIK